MPSPRRLRRAVKPLLGTLAVAGLAVPALAGAATPAAVYSYSPSSPVTGSPVTFDAAGSACGNATPCSYRWEDDGPDGSGGTQWALGSGVKLSFTFQNAGTKNVRLKVYDAGGVLRAQTVKAVTVRTPTTTTTTPTTTTTTPTTTTTTPTTTTTTPSTGGSGTPTTTTCSRSATTSTFASELSAATSGQTICLAAGNYGTFAGTAKAVTIRPQSGATVTMGLNFTTGDSGFTLDGITTPGGSITNGAKSITVKNSTFTGPLTLDGLANANILLDHNTHNNINAGGQYSSPARIHLPYSSSTPSGVTVQNSVLAGGDSDGIQAGTGLNIINNEFRDIIESGTNHTDAIQLLGAYGTVVRGNYIRHASSGIVAYDGISHTTIEDNVVDLTQAGAQRPWGIELYSDNGSTIRHNTVVYSASCSWNMPCGLIDLNRKSADPAGTGTTVVDNIATEIALNNGSTASVRKNNMVRRNAKTGDFLGTPAWLVATPAKYADFHLASGSAGKAKASDGLDVGIR